MQTNMNECRLSSVMIMVCRRGWMSLALVALDVGAASYIKSLVNNTHQRSSTPPPRHKT